jgi:hypothetical protein
VTAPTTTGTDAMTQGSSTPKLAGLRGSRGRLRRLETVLIPQQVKRIGQWSPKRQNLVKRCFSGGATRATAIKLMCLDCCGEDVSVVRECGDRCCPLWHFRPFQRMKISPGNDAGDEQKGT